MKNNKIFLKKLLSYIPFVNKFIRKAYYKYNYSTFFIPVDLKITSEQILQNNSYRLNLKNFTRFKEKFSYFLISRKSSFKDYPKIKLDKLLDFVKNNKAEVAYDGDDFYHTEITSGNVIDFYSNMLSLENYPHKFFYVKKNFNVKNIGSAHRSYNFNGSFRLPSGGKTIGDGGDVAARLDFIPNLIGKTFLDIGSEEGYAVFNALEKKAKFAKGLNINEAKDYDFFPEHLRPGKITDRNRNEITITQQFLIKEYGLEKNSNFKFEYNNIYNLGEEKFDFVFCFGVLYHLKNPYLALENLYKVTDETLIIETQGIKNDNYPNCRVDLEDGFIRHSSNALTILLKKVGFKKIKVLFDAYDSSMKISNIVLKATK